MESIAEVRKPILDEFIRRARGRKVPEAMRTRM